MTNKPPFLVRGIWLIAVMSGLTVAQEESGTRSAPPGWQNPDIGLTVDAVLDAHDAEGSWKSRGLTLRGAELIVRGSIDPYAELLGNVLFSEHGAELHEAFATFPFLPLNLRARAGLMLANFGRWNRFHLHAMPFTSEPRIYREYAGGMLALKGIELSWMAPINHFVEVTLSAYDRIQGHSHDSDPSQGTPSAAKTADQIAEEIGAEKHGPHWHGPNGEILYEEDLLRLGGQESVDDPVLVTGNRRAAGFSYGGRVTTTIELGDHFSVDIGANGMHQHHHRRSQRIDAQRYPKLLFGGDATLFWHPLTANRYRNLQVGTELLGSYEGTDRRVEGRLLKEYYSRIGNFGWIAYQHSSRWQFGGFGEVFQSNTPDERTNARYGAFVTLGISHYQYLRGEFSRYEYPGILDGVNRIQLQYDAAIGYHTHGRQR